MKRKTAFIIVAVCLAILSAPVWSPALPWVGPFVGPLLIFLASAAFLVRAPRTGGATVPEYMLAGTGAALSGLWLAFFAYYLMTFDLSFMG